MFKEKKVSAQIIDGKAIAATIRGEIADDVAKMKEQYGQVPGLATVLVGSRADSATYVRMKKRACAEVGITSFGYELPEDATQEEVLALVRELNANPEIDGILVQLPLPDHLDEEEVLAEIDLSKDVDGFHPLNIGRLSMKFRDPLFTPCTPKGCIELLDRMEIPIEGKRAVVLGRSNIVGLPVAMMLLHRNATLTICHSRTKDLPGVVREADILIAAVGRAQMVKGDWLKPGVAIIDVGINAIDDPTRKRGYRLVGDVDFEEAKEVAGYITPVPGGVGPMTIAMLLRNTTDGKMRSLGMN
jgi:5,10-methylene-tetrahydrofolate dehydrogenase/methenyl tetrahydrofolate cyclohydrolase